MTRPTLLQQRRNDRRRERRRRNPWRRAEERVHQTRENYHSAARRWLGYNTYRRATHDGRMPDWWPAGGQSNEEAQADWVATTEPIARTHATGQVYRIPDYDHEAISGIDMGIYEDQRAAETRHEQAMQSAYEDMRDAEDFMTQQHREAVVSMLPLLEAQEGIQQAGPGIEHLIGALEGAGDMRALAEVARIENMGFRSEL